MRKNHKQEDDFNQSCTRLLNNLIRQQQLHLKNECARLYSQIKKGE